MNRKLENFKSFFLVQEDASKKINLILAWAHRYLLDIYLSILNICLYYTLTMRPNIVLNIQSPNAQRARPYDTVQNLEQFKYHFNGTFKLPVYNLFFLNALQGESLLIIFFTTKCSFFLRIFLLHVKCSEKLYLLYQIIWTPNRSTESGN